MPELLRLSRKQNEEKMTAAAEPSAQTGAGLLVKSLEAQGVEYVWGVPRSQD